MFDFASFFSSFYKWPSGYELGGEKWTADLSSPIFPRLRGF
jgi:hypothetical protein